MILFLPYMDEKEFNKLFVNIYYYIHRRTTREWEVKNRELPWAELIYIIDGQAVYTINGEKYNVKKGDLLCIPRGCNRSAYTNPDNLMECYGISGLFYNSTLSETNLPFPLISNVGIHRDIFPIYKNLFSSMMERKPGYELKARGLFMVILSYFYDRLIFGSTNSNYDIRIRKAIEYIFEHFPEKITIQTVSNKIGLNAYYFGNLFKKETGKSFHQFLNNIRLNHAENMLSEGELNVNEVAWACGFSDPFYFSKLFKKERGVSPSKYIKH